MATIVLRSSLSATSSGLTNTQIDANFTNLNNDKLDNTATAAQTVASAVTFSGAITLSSTVAVTGAITFASTIAVTGAATLSSTLAVTGAVTLSSTLSAAGAVTFTSGDLTVNTNELVVDTSASAVGVGVAAPAKTLHVLTPTDGDGLRVQAPNLPAIQIKRDDITTANGVIDFLGSDDSVQYRLGCADSFTGAFNIKVGGAAASNTGLMINSSLHVGVGVVNATLLGKLHVDQGSLTGAVPSLYLDQADLSEEMIEFNSTIGTGNPIEAIAAKTLTTTHFIKVTLPGPITRYIPCGTIA